MSSIEQPDPAETIARLREELAVQRAWETRIREQHNIDVARMEAVRTLHRPWTDGGCCEHCQDGMGTSLPYPCPTIRALGEQARRAPARAVTDQEYEDLKTRYLAAVARNEPLQVLEDQ